jgi:hydrogenase expression/formation protein HypE
LQDAIVELSHGGGGGATAELIRTVFAARLKNPWLRRQEDAAVLPLNQILTGLPPLGVTDAAAGPEPRLALTTDSFVVTPLFFPGGDIGRLSIAGTVNDLLMMGAVPRFLTAGFILEEGLAIADLERIVDSMAQTAAEAGIELVAADTKVIEGHGGILINTSGIGSVAGPVQPAADQARPGDVIIISGPLGDHQACIMSQRLGVQNAIRSDVAPLNRPVRSLLDQGMPIHCLRDITRGGLATVLNELVAASRCGAELNESHIPVRPETRALCDVLGLDPLTLANEGKFVAIVEEAAAEDVAAILRQFPESAGAAAIGRIVAGSGIELVTAIGGRRILATPWQEGLPRIC